MSSVVPWSSDREWPSVLSGQSAGRVLLEHLRGAAPSALGTVAPGRDDLLAKLRTYLNEVPVALDLLAPLLDGTGGRRILEVGSGIGAVSLCLAADGHHVVAIEPGGPGFEDMLILQAAVQQAAELFEAPVRGTVPELRIRVEQLDPEVHGRFDIAFSANVLEHVQYPLVALDRIASVLVDGGVQRHVCPNYMFPYEPHFFIPLVPFRPAATKWLLRGAVTESGLWQSLNFVTARQVRRWARTAGVEVRFDRGVLAESVERFLADEDFAERHSGISGVVRVVKRLGAVPLLRRLPASIVSPMRFTVAPRTRGESGTG